MAKKTRRNGQTVEAVSVAVVETTNVEKLAADLRANGHNGLAAEMERIAGATIPAEQPIIEPMAETQMSPEIVPQNYDPQSAEASPDQGREMVAIDKVRSDRAAEGKGKRMALVTGMHPDKTVSQISQAVLVGIMERHIAHAVEEVTIKAKTSPTKKDESRSFDAFYALDAEGMMILCNGKIEPATPPPAEGKDERTDEQKAYGACDHFNYGRLLNVRQVERGRLEASIEGPEKSIAKLVKAMIDGGLAESEGEAREEVIGRLKKKGQLAADYVWAGAAA